jgi:tRNA (cmo5U34)-methyltransferase
MTFEEFSFAAHARDFDRHIRDSIPGRTDLDDMCVRLSQRFVQNDTTVVDIGCSTGALLRSIRDASQDRRRSVSYLGIDVESGFSEHWRARRARNVRFRICDARSFDGYENLSLACSLFTLQFIPERDRLSLLRRVCDGLIEGGALILAEKVYANDAKFQEMLRSIYYDFKRQNFSAEEILDKERSLRGQMNPWSEEQWLNAVHEAGFKVHRLWHNHLFVAWVVEKGASRRSAGIVPFRRRIERPNDRGLVTNPGTATIHPRREIIFTQDRALGPLLAARKRGRLIVGRK